MFMYNNFWTVCPQVSIVFSVFVAVLSFKAVVVVRVCFLFVFKCLEDR